MNLRKDGVTQAEGDARYLRLNGANANQNIDFGGYTLNSISTPIVGTDAANKDYVDQAVTALNSIFYMIDDASGVGSYKLTQLDPTSGAEQSVTSGSLSDGDTLLQGWISPVGMAPTTLIKGVYNMHVHAAQQNPVGAKTVNLYWELVEYKTDTSEVVIDTSEVTTEGVTTKDGFDIHLVLASDYILSAGSRVIGKVYARVTGGGNAPVVILYYDNNTFSGWEIPTNREILSNSFLLLDGSNANQNIDIGSYNFTTTGNLICNTAQIDAANSGPLLKNSAGTLEVRNSSDTGYADVKIDNILEYGGTASYSMYTRGQLAGNIYGSIDSENTKITLWGGTFVNGSQLSVMGNGAQPGVYDGCHYMKLGNYATEPYYTWRKAYGGEVELMSLNSYGVLDLLSGLSASSGTITANSITDGTLIINGGNLTSVGTINGTAVGDLGSTINNNLYNSMLGNIKAAEAGNFGAYEIVNGWVDAYEDETGVDTVTSTNETFVTGYYQPSSVADNTVLLIHCDGADASTDFVDEATAKAITAVGDAQVDTAIVKFGTGALLLGGTADYLSLLDSDDWNFSTGDFTIDMQVYFDTLTQPDGGFGILVSQYAGNSDRWLLYWDNTNGMAFYCIGGGGATISFNTGKTGWNATTWHHVALVRYGTSFNIYRDGTSVGNTTNAGSLPSLAATLQIGTQNSGTNDFDGNLDEIRIVKGEAMWTANFVAPTEAYSLTNYNNMTLVSGTYNAITADPDTVYTFVQQEDIDSITLNTDLTIDATIDGSTWATGTLSKVGTSNSINLLTASMDVSGQTGNSVRYRINTANNKGLKIHGIGVYYE